MLVLLFHRMGRPPAGVRQRKLYVTATDLCSHVDWLKRRGYRFATVSQALELPDPVACVTFDDGFREVVTEAAPALDVPATVFAVTSRVGERQVTFDGDQGVAPGDLATWDELKRLRDRGWEIGSHAHHHNRKPTLADLQESQQALLRNLGQRATALAYPYGAYDELTIADARTAAFRCAVTTKSGKASRDAPFALRRTILSSFGVAPGFERLKLHGVHLGIYPLRPRPL